MITVERYLPYNEFEIHPRPENVHTAEEQALGALVDAFSVEMKAKLIAKMREGRNGWDDPVYRANIEAGVRKHVERALNGEGQWADAANMLAMLWNFEQGK